LETIMSENERNEHIRVRVSFPISKKGPYEAEVAHETTVGVVLADAMGHFEVQNDSQFTYVLAYVGLEQNDSTTIGSLAGEKDEIKFTLVKKITQG
jgi:hypothetical protein